jgi:hypothetical protein
VANKRKVLAQWRAQHHAMLRSSAFQDELDAIVVRCVKRPNEHAPPSLTLTGRFDRVRDTIIEQCVRYQVERTTTLPFYLSNRRIQQSLDRLVRVGLLERIYEPPEKEKTFNVVFGMARLNVPQRQARKGKTYYRAIGLLEAIARASQ